MKKHYQSVVLVLLLAAACNPPMETAVIEGQPAPEIELPSTDSQLVALSSLQGNIVLVDFWASWCGPCRRMNPFIKSLYDEYKSAEFSNGASFIIYSVSLDEDWNNWVAAIAKDRLDWPHHVSDLRGWHSAAALSYKINAIPANVLIDARGRVIGKDLTIAEIEQNLKERLR